jgi:hypothetical protein
LQRGGKKYTALLQNISVPSHEHLDKAHDIRQDQENWFQQRKIIALRQKQFHFRAKNN